MAGVLERQVKALCDEDGGADISFAELHRLTDVELDIVAVDLNRQRPIIFNYELTPKVRVASAVVASAAWARRRFSAS